MSYEELLMEAERQGLIVKEMPLQFYDGRCMGKRIAIRKSIPTLKEKADVLAEEIGHYQTTVGDILDQTDSENRKQERDARLIAYNIRIGLSGIISAYKANCKNIYEIAEHLDVSEKFLTEALACYRQIYGSGAMVDHYYIQFEPNLQIFTYHQV